MAAQCQQCASEVGWFSRRKVRRPDGSVSVLCKPCALEAGTPLPSTDAALRALEAPAAECSLDDPTSRAAAEHRARIDAAPADVESYRALYSLYAEAGDLDRAWCVCAALVYLGGASSDETELHQRFAPDGFAQQMPRIDATTWSRIYHPDLDRLLSAILAIVWPAGLAMRAQSRRSYALTREQHRDASSDPSLVCRLMTYLAQVVGVSLPAVYFQDRDPGALLFANCLEKGVLGPSFVCRRNVLRNRNAQELAFRVAERLARLRAEHVLGLALPTDDELECTVAAAVAPARMDERTRSYAATFAEGLSSPRRHQLERLILEMGEPPPSLDISSWRRAVAATCDRVGLLVCRDLGVAASIVLESPPFDEAQRQQRIDDLVRFSVSDNYFALREALGLAIHE